MGAAEGRAGGDCSGDDPPPHCLHFPTHGGCSSSEAWETRVNNGSAERGERGRTLWERNPLGGGLVAWSRKGREAVYSGEDQESIRLTS